MQVATTNRLSAVTVSVLLLTMGRASAQQTLTAQDRADNQELSAKYAKALGSCAAEDYAEVFVPETGYYADEYVKTSKGWRIKARTVITGQEQKADLSVADVTAIRRLAGTDLGQFDVYVAGPDEVKRFRTAGVALGLSADGVTGRALLKNDGGYYEDVYVRTQQGGWRVKSRAYVAADAAPAGTTRAQP
jgi:hypothetical protein